MSCLMADGVFVDVVATLTIEINRQHGTSGLPITYNMPEQAF